MPWLGWHSKACSLNIRKDQKLRFHPLFLNLAYSLFSTTKYEKTNYYTFPFLDTILWVRSSQCSEPKCILFLTLYCFPSFPIRFKFKFYLLTNWGHWFTPNKANIGNKCSVNSRWLPASWHSICHDIYKQSRSKNSCQFSCQCFLFRALFERTEILFA